MSVSSFIVLKLLLFIFIEAIFIDLNHCSDIIPQSSSSHALSHGGKLCSDASIKSFDIKCILSDMDGTLLSSHHRVSDNTLIAVRNTMSKGYPFYPCTGRTRSSMANAAGEEFISLFGKSIIDVPGVYQQGLMVYGTDGTLIYERCLENDVILAIQEFCDRYDVPALAYAGEEIFCRARSILTDKVTEVFDPLPIEFSSGIDKLSIEGIKVHKIIILAEDDSILTQIRPILENELAHRVTITKAMAGMLEVLPLGASKGFGVRKFLEHLNIKPHRVLAFGDGENDIEMLSLVGVSVAMENASWKLKAKSTHLTLSNDAEGVAFVLNHLPPFIFPANNFDSSE